MTVNFWLFHFLVLAFIHSPAALDFWRFRRKSPEMNGSGDYQILLDDDRAEEQPARKTFNIGNRRFRTVRVGVPTFFVVLVSLPLVAFVFCILWTWMYDFEAATATHCRVENRLPSISAAIDFLPQGIVWRLAIGIHFPGRVLAVALYLRYYARVLVSEYQRISRAACWTHLTENLALLGLSFFTSDSNFGIHKTCFAIFLVASMIYMCMSLWINAYGRKGVLSGKEQCSFALKKLLVAANIICCAIAMYFYNQHVTYCFPMMYTYFCAFEYVVVVTNILFHGMAGLDMHRWDVVLPTGETYNRS